MPDRDSATGVEPNPRKGFAAALGAQFIWGFFPIYIRALLPISPLQIMAHRMVWCCLFVVFYLGSRGQLRPVFTALSNPSRALRLIASATLISINWFAYVWGVNNGHIVETSLGYFINPLVNVLLGVVILSERLNRVQWAAVVLATIGVTYMALNAGRLPWIAFTVALSFGAYGLIRKMIPVDAVAGLAAETLILMPVGLLYLLWCEHLGVGALGHVDSGQTALLVCSGIVTGVSLALYAFGARQLPYSTLGLIQYVAPTLQLLLGVFLYGEPFSPARIVGFSFIWLGLAIFATDRLWQARKVRMA